jgi:hypothetical protein
VCRLLRDIHKIDCAALLVSGERRKMEDPAEMVLNAKLKALLRHLVVSFPHASILSRPVEDRYHLFLIVPYGEAPEKTIRVERALLVERHLSVHDFVLLLDRLNITSFLERHNRYDLTHNRWSHIISKRARHRSSPLDVNRR